MKRLLLITSLVFSLVISKSHATEQIPTSPDLPALQSRVAELVSKQWKSWCKTYANTPVPPIKEVEIRMVRRADDLLTNISLGLDTVNPLKDKPVYLVHAVADSGFWKTTTEHLLVLQRVNYDWKLLLHFSGGWKGRGIAFKIVDLGVSSRREGILVADYASGNQMSQTRHHIFRYDKGKNQFVEIFNELTTWLPSVVPIVYESVVSFQAGNSALKDIVVRTQLIKQQSVETDFEMSRASVFKWDGKKYSGKLDLPISVQMNANNALQRTGAAACGVSPSR